MAITKTINSPTPKQRLTRSDWIRQAMQVLSSEGDARISIDRLCRELGVTKGSFYAHFRDRTEFVEQMVDHWNDAFTLNVIDAVNAIRDKPAESRLLVLMETIRDKRAISFDTVMRAWASHDPIVAKGVRKVDGIRYGFVRDIFADMGFDGDQLDLRTRLFVTVQSSLGGMLLPASGLSLQEEIKQQHAFFCRR